MVSLRNSQEALPHMFGFLLGKNCQLMDFCPANPCANGGTCVITYPVIVCQCRPGFDGHTCQQDINECFADPKPCLNGGTCINNIGSFRCICPPSSAGLLCQNRLGPCTPGVCLNGGTCHHVDERYHGCLCPPGYTGQHCEVNPDDCEGNQCRNGATCQDGMGSYTCHCLPGWTGLFCHLHDACLSNPCHPDAHCDTDLRTGDAVCTCQQGYAGPLCYEDINECQMGADPCEHGGSCHNTPGSFTCRCPEGYTGSRCESNLNECLSRPCQNGASCLDLLGQFQCLCPSGFGGPLCELEECTWDRCLNGGTCLSQSHGVACQCAPGFAGPRCKREVDSCISSPCRNGAQCQNSAGAFHCICPQGFEGFQCEREADLCHSAPCGHGTCIHAPGSFTCVCSPGYTGPFCTELSDPCWNWQCLNGGSCQGAESGPHCVCLPGWTGWDCGTEIDACNSSPCHQGATCLTLQGAFTCTCPSGYAGATCSEDIDECRSGPCLNSGTCLNSPGTFRCLCPKGYTGSKCHVILDLCAVYRCGNGGRCVMKEFVPHCLCPPGWGGSQCQEKTVQNGDNCTDLAGGPSCQVSSGGTGGPGEYLLDRVAKSLLSHGFKKDLFGSSLVDLLLITVVPLYTVPSLFPSPPNQPQAQLPVASVVHLQSCRAQLRLQLVSHPTCPTFNIHSSDEQKIALLTHGHAWGRGIWEWRPTAFPTWNGSLIAQAIHSALWKNSLLCQPAEWRRKKRERGTDGEEGEGGLPLLTVILSIAGLGPAHHLNAAPGGFASKGMLLSIKERFPHLWSHSMALVSEQTSISRAAKSVVSFDASAALSRQSAVMSLSFDLCHFIIYYIICLWFIDALEGHIVGVTF
ncbi:hypothetical protein EYD10_16957 [Varanus komodoensis]|nr:hypothetical protein EYD10_16957 [Varanus komodoensis]